MHMNLKKNIKQSILQYMEDSDIDADEIEDIELTSYELKRAIKEGNVETYYQNIGSVGAKSFLAIKLGNNVIPVVEKPE